MDKDKIKYYFNRNNKYSFYMIDEPEKFLTVKRPISCFPNVWVDLFHIDYINSIIYFPISFEYGSALFRYCLECLGFKDLSIKNETLYQGNTPLIKLKPGNNFILFSKLLDKKFTIKVISLFSKYK